MPEPTDLARRLARVDELLGAARPRPHREARLLAQLRAADRAPRSPSSVPFGRSGRRPLAVALAAAILVLAVLLRLVLPARSPEDASPSRGALDADLDPDPRADRASVPPYRTPPSDEPGPAHRVPASPEAVSAPPSPDRDRLDAEAPPAPFVDPGDGLRARRSDRSAASVGSARASSGSPGVRVLWAQKRPEAAATPRGRYVRPGPAAPQAATPCEPADILVDRARGDCEAQGLALAEERLAYLDACGDEGFRGLEYSCVRGPAAPPSAKGQAGCTPETLPPAGACRSEEDTRSAAARWCEDAGLVVQHLVLEPGSCPDGFEGAYLFCCEEGSDVPMGKSRPLGRPAGREEDEGDGAEEP
jgi:hypothetical protein